MSQPLLVLPNLKKPFQVYCDASGDCLGVILLQEGQPIAYEGRHMHTHKRTLGIYEKDLLAIILALDSWKHYLLSTTFVFSSQYQIFTNTNKTIQ